MLDDKIASWSDSTVYARKQNGQMKLYKKYNKDDLALILKYTRIQDRYAGIPFLIDKIFFENILYKWQAIQSASFTILHLDEDLVGLWSSIETKTQHVFSNLSYVGGDTMSKTFQNNYLTFKEWYDSWKDFPTILIQNWVFESLVARFPIFKNVPRSLYNKIPYILDLDVNMKAVSFSNGHLELCITDIGWSIHNIVEYIDKESKL
jgi:hypothetical protein